MEPDEVITVDKINALIADANRKLKNAVTSAISNTKHGISISPVGKLEPIYGLLTNYGPLGRNGHHYEWVQVFEDVLGTGGEWVEKPGGYRSILDSSRDPTVILHPAVEVNHIKGVDLNTIVRLYPAERLSTDEYNRTYREWFFSADPGLKAMILDQDLIPTGGGEPDTLVTGHFLGDLSQTSVDFYPASTPIFADQNGVGFRLGIGRGPGGYSAGTAGWAKWVDRAVVDWSTGGPVWFGQWQIVTIYAQLIADVRVKEGSVGDEDAGDAIAPGATGECELWWADNDQEGFELVNSKYKLQITNNLEFPIMQGARLRVEFNRHDYRWYPLHLESQEQSGKVQGLPTGGNAAGTASRVVSLKACDWEGNNVVGDAFDSQTQIRDDLDTHVFTDDIVKYVIEPDGTKVITSPYVLGPPIGAIRRFAVAPAVAARLNAHGWWLMDTTHGTVDSKGRFFMGIDVADASGDGREDVIGKLDGHRWHGPTENNHVDHLEAELEAAMDDHTALEVEAILDNHAKAEVSAAIKDHDAISDHDPHSHGHSASGTLSTTSSDHDIDTEVVPPHDAISAHDAAAGGAGLEHDATGDLEHSFNRDIGHTGTHNAAGNDVDNRPRYVVTAPYQYTGVP